jgi:hypothetical protein
MKLEPTPEKLDYHNHVILRIIILAYFSFRLRFEARQENF